MQDAAGLAVDSLQLLQAVGDREATATCLELLAGLAVELGDPTRGARLLGATEALRSAIDAPIGDADRETYDRDYAAARLALGEGPFAAAWDVGRTLDLDAAVREASVVAALSGAGIPASDGGTAGSLPAESSGFGLTAREMDVLRLLAAGASSREIAEALFISPRTLTTHVANILGKLGVGSRAAAVSRVFREGLV